MVGSICIGLWILFGVICVIRFIYSLINGEIEFPEKPKCPKCGSTRVKRYKTNYSREPHREGRFSQTLNTWDLVTKCKDCGHIISCKRESLIVDDWDNDWSEYEPKDD